MLAACRIDEGSTGRTIIIFTSFTAGVDADNDDDADDAATDDDDADDDDEG